MKSAIDRVFPCKWAPYRRHGSCLWTRQDAASEWRVWEIGAMGKVKWLVLFVGLAVSAVTATALARQRRRSW